MIKIYYCDKILFNFVEKNYSFKQNLFLSNYFLPRSPRTISFGKFWNLRIFQYNWLRSPGGGVNYLKLQVSQLSLPKKEISLNHLSDNCLYSISRTFLNQRINRIRELFHYFSTLFLKNEHFYFLYQ